MKTDYKGIDYSNGRANVDKTTGIHYGVLPMNEVCQSWCDSSEPFYGAPEPADCPECGHGVPAVAEWGETAECGQCGHEWEIELPEYAEPLSHYVDDEKYSAQCGEDGDIFIVRSPYFTRAQFCSPCAPGACYLLNPCDDGEKAYCFGPDWFENCLAPYPVYSVETGELVLPQARH